jgi:hypothetical protein
MHGLLEHSLISVYIYQSRTYKNAVTVRTSVLNNVQLDNRLKFSFDIDNSS